MVLSEIEFFSLIDDTSIEEFDRSMTTQLGRISWYSKVFGTTEGEIAKVYLNCYLIEATQHSFIWGRKNN